MLTTENTENSEKITENPDSVDAHVIGQIQLEEAIKFHNIRNFICAITLARAADEYLGKLLSYATGKKPAMRNLQELIQPYTKTKIDLNYIGNNLKHFNENFCEVEHNIRGDSFQLICRGICNLIDLNIEPTAIIKDFISEHIVQTDGISTPNMQTKEPDLFETSSKVIDFAIKAHKALGPGLLESAYQNALAYYMLQAGINFEKEKPIPVLIEGKEIGTGYKADFVVEDFLVIETKSVEKILPIHEAQLLTYLKLGKYQIGLLLNFNEMLMKNGIKRFKV